jgi:hypothetical protein
MTPITMYEFEEIIKKDEALVAKAKEIGSFEDKKEKAEKIQAFAESLGYTLKVESAFQELTEDDLCSVTAGDGGINCIIFDNHHTDCNHKLVYVKEIPGAYWGTNSLYRCTKCSKLYEYIWPFMAYEYNR